MSEELWTVCSVSTRYMVSSHGRIKSLARKVMGGRGYRLLPETILSPMLGSSGYPKVKIEGKQYQVHTLVLSSFVGQRPAGMVCAHGDGSRTNNRLENLRWTTYAQNANDMIGHGTRLLGERNHVSKLTEAHVRAIRADRRRRIDVAKDYGVTPEAISRIMLRKNWGWLP